MTEQPNKASLYQKLATVAGQIETVEKDGRNKDQGYRYATPAGVFLAIKPHLAAVGLAIVPHLVGFEAIDTGQTSRSGSPYILNRVSMHYHVLDGDSGEEMVVPWQAQAGTYGDDKGLAKAQTIALRTFLIQLFQIPAEDPETDPDAAGANPIPRPRAAYDAPAEPARPARQQAPAAATNGHSAECPVHHKPFREGKNGGLYCPTKLEDGSWCKERPAKPARTLPDGWTEDDYPPEPGR